MNELKNNKVLIIISIALISLTLLIIWIANLLNNENAIYELSDKEFLRNYQINEVIPVTVNDENMARIYLAEYIRLLFNDPSKAYELLDEEYKLKKYPTYDSFMEYVNLILNEKLYKATLLKYEAKIVKGYKVYDLYDVSNTNFLFKESSIMNYSVLLDNYTIY